MSQLNVNTITNEAGTGAPDFTSGLKVGGTSYPSVGPLSNRNKIINGNFDVWQRGTSGSSGYVADRWITFVNGTTAAITQQAFALGQTDVPGEPTYFHRVVVTSVAGAGNFAFTTQLVEFVRTLAGQTATVSFWAKADAAKNITVEFRQNFGGGGSPSASVDGIGATTVALTTSWQKFTVTAAIPSISGKTIGTSSNDFFQLTFWFDAGSDFNARSNSLGQQSGTFDIAQVQLEAGDTATPFEHRSFGQELALCQRYFEVYRIPSGTTTALIGQVVSSSVVIYVFSYKTEKRTAPTFFSTGTWVAANASAGSAGGSIGLNAANQYSARLDINGASGIVAGNAALLFSSTTNGTLQFNAEL